MSLAVRAATTPTLGLVLKRFDFSESSQTGKLLTRDFGRVSVLAKGIRRGGADLRGPMDILDLAEVEILQRKRSDLHLLTRYRVVTGFRGLRRSLERLWAGFYVTEVLREGTRDEDPDAAIFDLAIDVLAALEVAGPAEVASVVSYFDLHFLERLGLRPNFDACVLCERAAPKIGPVRFGPPRGGLVCRSCHARRPQELVLISASLRAVLDDLRHADGAAVALRYAVSPPLRKELRRFLSRLIEVSLECELRARGFVAS